MSLSLIVAGVGAVVAAIGVGMLMARCLRAPRGDLVAWLVAMLGLLISLGAQALGYLMGFSAVSFRAMEIGAQLIAPLALVIGLGELVVKGLPGRFAARLFLPALGFVALVILGTDPLSGQAFTKTWPSPELYYQLIPNNLLEYGIGLVTVLLALGFGIAGLARGRSERGAMPAAACAVLAVVVLAVPAEAPALSHHAGITVPLSSIYSLLCLIAAAATWYAGVAASRVSQAALRGTGGRDAAGRSADGRPGDGRAEDYDGAYGDRYGRQDDDSWGGDGWRGAEPTGDFDTYGDLFRDAPAPSRNAPAGDSDYGWQDGRDRYNGSQQADGDYDSREFDPVYGRGEFETGMQDPFAAGRDSFGAAPGQRAADLPPAQPDSGREDLFGQIAIYTLIEDRVHEFDRLTERVVAKVRGSEPDTLVFIVHAVPSAPMQRILYEVYKDRAAYDRHQLQPYVTEFEDDRRPYVLATNVIELGLQQAKVSPFPSIADLFGEPGYDTSGFERPDYTREYGSSSGASGGGNGRGPSGLGGSGMGGGSGLGGAGQSGTRR